MAGVLSHKAVTIGSSRDKENNILFLINCLRLICNHGKDLLAPPALRIWETRDRTSKDWQMMQKWRNICDICKREIEGTDSFHHSACHDCDHSICTACTLQAENSSGEDDIKCPKCTLALDDIADSEPTAAPIRASANIEALLRNLRTEQRSGIPEKYYPM
jgi:hypothetical protein